MQRAWVIHPPHPAAVRLADELGIHPLVAELVAARGMTTPATTRRFFANDLRELSDPRSLLDMDRAVDRIEQALARRERICVVSDYDVDGLTSTALLVRVLADLGGHPITYVPHRVKDGYGFSRKAVEYAQQEKASVVITVDSGSTAHEPLAAARAAGLDVIVVDHHEMAHVDRPPAYALINPLQEGCGSPDKDLASVGLAFKLAQALLMRRDRAAAWDHLDLVCLGTVADVAPLRGENRILVHHGLQRLGQTTKVGLRALMDVAELRTRTLTTEHVGFILGPRINAAGRMNAPDTALKLLLTDDRDEARQLAAQLHEENRQRQQVEAVTLREAVAKVDRDVNFAQERVIVVHGDGWHPGVIGIVASRLVERYHRPSIVVTVTDGVGKGSARSIHRFHLVEALAECKQTMLGFGGHEAAAGLTITAAQLPVFREAINAVAAQRMAPEHLVPQLTIDAEVPLAALTPELMTQLERLAPCGAGNPTPVFASRQLTFRAPPQPAGRTGLRCWVRQSEGPCLEAVGYDRADRWRDRLAGATQPFALAYTPVRRRTEGIETIQLQIKDVQES